MKKLSKAKDILINTHYMVCVHVWSLQGKHMGKMMNAGENVPNL